MPAPELEVVIPVYDEGEIIDQLHDRVVQACHQASLNFRITYVDDGSTDNTAQWISNHAIPQGTPWASVQLIQLSRNFGQPAAISAGLNASTGACVVLMDGDLQDPPELIPELVDRWRWGDEIVIAQRTERQETFWRGLAFKTFHTLFRWLADADIPPNTGTYCLMDRRAVEAICQLPESHRFFPGLRAWVGFKQSVVPHARCERAGGRPKQTFGRLVQYAMDAILGYSLKPLRLMTALGGVICLIALCIALGGLVGGLMGTETRSFGLTLLTCGVFGLGGIQLIGMGILGEYIGRIYDEAKHRPPYLITQTFETDTEALANEQKPTDRQSLPYRRVG